MSDRGTTVYDRRDGNWRQENNKHSFPLLRQSEHLYDGYARTEGLCVPNGCSTRMTVEYISDSWHARQISFLRLTEQEMAENRSVPGRAQLQWSSVLSRLKISARDPQIPLDSQRCVT